MARAKFVVCKRLAAWRENKTTNKKRGIIAPALNAGWQAFIALIVRLAV